jgi:hypothetical protein
LLTVRGIQDHEFPTVGQRPRARAARPLISTVAQKVFARLGRKILDALEINDEQFGELRQRKWIERVRVLNAGKVAQTQRIKLKLFSLFAGRK